MLVSSALVPKPQPPCKLPSSSKSRVDDQLQHDEHSNDFNIWNSEQFSHPIASTAERATSLSMLSSTNAGSSLSQTANLQTVFNLIATLVSNVEEIKKTLKLHTSLLHSIKQKVLATEELIFDLPEDIKLPLTTIAEVETLEEKLFCVEKKKILAKHISDIGGEDLRNFVMRAMPVLLDGQLARQFNLTGQKGKKSFKALLLSQVFLSAVKLNPNTNQYNNKDIEIELSKWFSNARDRGIDGRRYTITKATMTTPSSD
ncbi:uncharacterized protein LOC136083724 isoform X2 [Hydra vulgaris]|uniref:Uncharacterized protein LOC136083724 isoform X2 n=1 Tax=Hydra vulgaris TaxID=6087 RepID=A0ABM4CCQ0_HYDVU